MGQMENRIRKIFAEKPSGHPSRWEDLRFRESILVLAQEMDRQNEEMVVVFHTAQKVLVAIGKLDEKFEKAGL